MAMVATSYLKSFVFDLSAPGEPERGRGVEASS